MRSAWLIIGLCLLAGCGNEEHADLRAFMAQTGQGGQQPLEPLPPMQTPDSFAYEAGELPDPFKPRIVKPLKGGGGGIQPDLNRPKGPLEQFPLDGLHMVGTLHKAGQLQALVRTPENVLYRVKQGDYMGLNHGLVLAVGEAAIEIREIVQDGAGNWAESKATLTLQGEKKE